ncbi:hypothetical protein CYY_005204 [Polysphondylium violaceum]|uniref:Rad50/SbcC-type AAA domain-containing protein n=1 Tax=Polysphondylium violaceum TaxID=133409 RepID=A0A8J4PTT0_9MYCE|nr:hypothetical protein CYY_005204 [Polysphondylium violaceum]
MVEKRKVASESDEMTDSRYMNTKADGTNGKKFQKLDDEEEFESSQPQKRQTRKPITEEESDEDERPHRNGKVAPRQKKQEEEEEEEMDEEEEEKDEEEDNSYQNIPQREEPESGIIELISLENFMCHRRFEIKLGNNVNFISGENGSGKSALLVALIITLGAKAGFTNRGHKLTDLIKHEAKQAVIRVKLRNRGSEAYKPELYGDSIIVERTIRKNGGGSGYKLKNSTGEKTISDKFNELSLILEQFNIQIDNPIAILMQDTSRQFLNTSTPSDKYKLFLTATQLDQMTKDYNSTLEHIEQMKTIIGTKNVLIEEMEKKVEKNKQEYMELQHVIDLEKEMVKIKHQLAWLLVTEQERRIEDKKKEITEIDTSLLKTLQAKDKFEDDFRKIEEAIVKVREDTAVVSSEIEKIEAERQKTHEEMSGFTKQENSTKAMIDDLSMKINGFKRREQSHQRALEETRARNARLSNNQKKIEDIEKKKESISQIELHTQNLGSEKESLSNRIAAKEPDIRDSSRAESAIQANIGKLEKQLSTYRASKGDTTRVYGDQIGKLLTLIRSNHRQFSRPPIGPVGLSLKVKDDLWSLAIETACTKTTLRSFIVFSYEDSAMLNKLMSQMNLKLDISIVEHKDSVYDIPRFGHGKVTTMLSVLEADDPNVINFLVDYKKIETLCLAKTRQEGESIIDDPNSGFTDVYMANGANLSKTKRGNIMYTAEKPNSTSTMLRPNFDQIIRQTLEELEESKQLLSQKKRQGAQEKEEVQQWRVKANQIEREINDMQRKKFTLESDIKAIEDTLNVAAEDTAEMEDGIAELQNNIREHQARMEELMESLSEFTDKRSPFLAKIKELTQKKNSVDQQMQKYENTILQHQKQQRTCRIKADGYIQSINQLQHKKNEGMEEIEALSQSLNGDIAKASEICERVEIPDRENRNTLTQKIKNFEKQIEEETRGKKSRAEALATFKESRDSLYSIAKQRDDIQEIIRLLEKNLNERYQKWQRLRSRISQRTGFYFNVFLSRKNYTGSLVFDHKENTLDVNVQLNKMGSKSAESKGDTKGLSGGERSFSTVSLLLSFWETMESPFRAMDEFDVFMDEVNRRISIDLLLSKAKEHKSKQYIFVTPLSLNSINPSPFIYVHKVRPPLRNQSTIIDSSGGN